MKMIRPIATGMASAALMLTGGVLLWFGMVSAYRGESTLLAVCVAGAILLIFAATIDRFESVKGLGVEAKTRQLDRKLVEADQAIDQIRRLAEILGKESVAANTKLGRMDAAPTTEESYLHAQAVKGVMVGLGSKPETIRNMMRPFVHMMLFDMTTAILRPVDMNISKRMNELRRTNLRAGESAAEKASREAAQSEAYDFQQVMVMRLYNSLSIEDYPSEVLSRLTRLSLIDDDVRETAQREILRFSAEMLLLRAEGRLEKPEDWFARVAVYRNRDSLGG